MAMRIAVVPYFWATVAFSMLGDDDKSIDVSFKAKFKRLTQEEHEAMLERVQTARLDALTKMRLPLGIAAQDVLIGQEPKDAASEGQKPITDREIIDLVLLDWDEVLGDDDQKLPFNKDNLDRLLKALGCRAAIVKRFFDLHQKEQEKNFAPRPATTTAT